MFSMTIIYFGETHGSYPKASEEEVQVSHLS